MTGTSAFGERRARWLLLALLLGQFVFLSLQVPAADESGSRLEALALRLVAPLPRAIAGLGDLLERGGGGLASRRALTEENLRLGAENRELRERLLLLEDVENDLGRLGAAVEYERASGAPLRAADVVYADHTSWLRTLILWTPGSGLRASQPVVSPEGVVGRVWRVAGPYAKVQLITDRAASVGAMLERTRRQGIVHGGEGGLLLLGYVPLQADVQLGDRVLTSGIDGVYPRGLPIGTVTSVERGDQVFHHIVVAPSVDLGSLDQVYILDRTAVPRELRERSLDHESP